MFGLLLSPLRWLVSIVFSPWTLALVVVLVWLLYRALTRHKNYWRDRGVEHIPFRFPLGNAGFDFFRKPYVDILAKDYAKLKQAAGVLPHFDINGPAVYVSDLELLNNILIKDFDCFPTRSKGTSGALGLFSKMLITLRGQEWKDVRSITTPIFSTGKIRQMCGPCETQAEMLAEQMCKESLELGDIDIKEMMGRFTVDNIASVAFGAEADAIRNPKSFLAETAAKLTQRPSLLILPLRKIAFSLPKSAVRRLNLSGLIASSEATQHFERILREAIRRRQAEPEQQRRPDYLQMMLDTRKDNSQRRQLTDDEIVAQCLLFYIAGHDTTSHALTWAARLLAFNPDVQKRAQAEIDGKVKSEADRITFDMVNDMPYLESVLLETLRLFPPTAVLIRTAANPYRLPGTELEIPADCKVYIPVFCLQRDADLYPEPERFDPDRFTAGERAGRHPCAWMPFGLGPRNCIGRRFALLEMKLALAAVLRRCSFVPGPRSGGARPLIAKGNSMICEQDGTWLRVEKRQ